MLALSVSVGLTVACVGGWVGGCVFGAVWGGGGWDAYSLVTPGSGFERPSQNPTPLPPQIPSQTAHPLSHPPIHSLNYPSSKPAKRPSLRPASSTQRAEPLSDLHSRPPCPLATCAAPVCGRQEEDKVEEWMRGGLGCSCTSFENLRDEMWKGCVACVCV